MTTQHYDDPHQLVSARVVVGIDDSDGAETALVWATDFAARRGRNLHIVHGMGLTGNTSSPGAYAFAVPEITDEVRAAGKALVEHAERTVRRMRPQLKVSVELAVDGPAGALIDRSPDAYAVVLGATGSVGTLAHLGSTLLQVTAHARGTVIVVRTDPDSGDTVRTSGPVVVGIDGSPVSEAAIAAAFAEAAERDADLVAVHVWSDWDFTRFAGHEHLRPGDAEVEQIERVVLAERLAGWQEKYPHVRPTRKVSMSAPAAELRRWSKSAQLVVVGSRGRGGFEGLLFGSTANSLVQHAHCPVMVVHPPA